MAEVIYTEAAFRDLRYIHAALNTDDPTLASNSAALIRASIAVLAQNPMAGRPAEVGLRERVISRGRTGYVALYRFLELDDTVLVLAIQHRREAGYPNSD